MSYKTTPHFGFKAPESNQLDDVPTDMYQLALEIEELLQDFPVNELEDGTAGQLIIAQGTGAAAYKLMSGDATLSSGGVLTIGESKVTAAKIAAEAVEAAKIALGAVTEAKIAGEAVAEAKLKNLAVSAAKLANEAVETGKLKNSAVTEAKLAALAVATAKIAEEAVTTAKIANLAVTTAKLAEGAVSAIKMAAGAFPVGRVKATSKLVCTSSYADIPGATKSITVARASLLVVVMTFDFYAPNSTTFQGALNLGGVVQEPIATYVVPGGTSTNTRTPVTQTVVAEIPTGSVTAKLQAKRNGEGPVVAELEPANTGFTYMAFPN